ncbi:hypothetical protein RHMOL_Rhmol01G0014400 [Rhododendron molle]|uniref:Uncharacterized protein n=1 Tax=Rhododendron molle TaxID=49168 RepID=A0ACC0PXJ0_RHOML|nr:hypothetical protein RHMOL_Rhmol01G0014400 [Rhododendron molle]
MLHRSSVPQVQFKCSLSASSTYQAHAPQIKCTLQVLPGRMLHRSSVPQAHSKCAPGASFTYQVRLRRNPSPPQAPPHRSSGVFSSLIAS